jgi:putative acyl-CoA dehydrogenase
MPAAAPPPGAVFNQPPPLEDVNLWEADRVLREAVECEGGGWIAERARELGAVCGSGETLELGRLANAHPPVLHTHDRYGHRRDEVEYHPAYHRLMELAVRYETHSLPWTSDRPGRHVARGALLMLQHQVDEGTSCPITMTFAVVPSLRLEPDLVATWEPRVLSTGYDPRLVDPAEKSGCTFGMAMTERQGGSDVRTNTTRAEATDENGLYRITGHKWFCSAPMSDAFLALAQAERSGNGPGGLTCFLMPRVLPGGERNALRFQRLKDKLGNRSNASSEVEFDGALAWRVGEEGRGVPSIIEMVRHTRLDCALGSAATLRRATAEALHHAAHRETFGRRLVEHPLMQNVLADLALESEAATALALRLARGFDEAEAGDVVATSFTRFATPIAKYWVTKRAVAGVAEAMECLGGNGYVEDSGLPRLYRDVPVNAIWEGSGNVQALDVLRAAGRHPEALAATLDEVKLAAGGDARLDVFTANLERQLADTSALEFRARRLTEALALALQASLLVRHAPAAVADAFCASRLGDGGHQLGTLPAGVEASAIIERHRPTGLRGQRAASDGHQEGFWR